jgi:hypothetical protein
MSSFVANLVPVSGEESFGKRVLLHSHRLWVLLSVVPATEKNIPRVMDMEEHRLQNG